MEANKTKNFVAIMLLAAAGFGVAGGVVGQLVSQAYLADSFIGLPGAGEIDFSQSSRSNLVISAPRKVVVEQNDKVAETVAGARNSLVGIYAKKTGDQGQGEFLEQYFAPAELVGQGLVITSDGWVVTNFVPGESGWSGLAVVTADQRSYESDRQSVDPATGLTILHIPAKDLPVKSFADPAGLASGQLALSIGWFGASQLNTVISPEYQAALVEQSDRSSQEMVLADAVNPLASGPAVFNLAGEVAGLVTAKGKVLPASQLAGVLPGLLSSQQLKRPSLGLSYADVSRLVGIDSSDLTRPKEGALVLRSPTGQEKKLGLEAGDIIIQVGGRRLSSSLSLNEAIQSFAPGAKVQLVFWRAGKQSEQSVRLEELK